MCLTKDHFRARMRARRAALGSRWIDAVSRRIQDRVAALDEFRRAAAVGCYVAVDGEVRTDRLIAACLAGGKSVGVPAFDGGVGGYRLAWIDAQTRWVAGRWGIPEPEVPSWARTQDLDLMVIPGVAFDVSCGRLGHGAGCYDRLLGEARRGGGHKGASRPVKLGVAFDFQLVECLPLASHDVRMDVVVTEQRILRVPDTKSGQAPCAGRPDARGEERRRAC